jgi:hypothetical protein
MLSVVASGAELTEKEATAAKAKQAEELESLDAKVAALEQRKLAAGKAGDRPAVRDLIIALKEAKAELRKSKAKTLQDFAQQIVQEQVAKEAQAAAERAQAEQKALAQKMEMERVAAERAEAARREEAERVAKADRERAEAERVRKSGGCPIELVRPGFYNANADTIRRYVAQANVPNDLFGESSFVSCFAVNCGDEHVEAFELLVQFLNGFDEVVAERKLQGTRLVRGEEYRVYHGWPRIETAVQVKIFVERTKTQSGDTWHRKPEHECVSVSCKRSDTR